MNDIFDPLFWNTGLSVASTLLWAVALGGLIGIERQWRQRLAGVRTNALVALGAAAFTLFAHMLPHQGVDSVARVAAQVVSGIGFLGAGVIMRDGFTVHGLTTAATLWCSAAVGVLVGADLTMVGVISAFLVLTINLLLRPVSRAIDAKTRRADNREINVITITASPQAAIDVQKVLLQWVDLAKVTWVSWSISQHTATSVFITCKLSGLEAADPAGRHIMQVVTAVPGIQSIALDVEKLIRNPTLE